MFDFTLREMNSHHNYKPLKLFQVMKTEYSVETAFQQYKTVIKTIYIL